jgi:RNA-binding protein YhbY
MKKLTNNQKKFLRARGHTLKSIVMVGQPLTNLAPIKSPEVSAALMAIFIKVLFAWKDNLWLFVKGTINHHYITNYLY